MTGSDLTTSTPRLESAAATPGEEWRPIAADPRYLVSNKGRVVGARGRLLVQHAKEAGYRTVHVSGLGPLYVHRLVALAFLGEPPEGCTDVDHGDDDKANNDVDNLEWVTHAENMRRAAAGGRMNPRRGSACGNAKLTESDVAAIRERLGRGETQRGIAADFGVSQPLISHIASGRNWTRIN